MLLSTDSLFLTNIFLLIVRIVLILGKSLLVNLETTRTRVKGYNNWCDQLHSGRFDIQDDSREQNIVDLSIQDSNIVNG